MLKIKVYSVRPKVLRPHIAGLGLLMGLVRVNKHVEYPERCSLKEQLEKPIKQSVTCRERKSWREGNRNSTLVFTRVNRQF